MPTTRRPARRSRSAPATQTASAPSNGGDGARTWPSRSGGSRDTWTSVCARRVGSRPTCAVLAPSENDDAGAAVRQRRQLRGAREHLDAALQHEHRVLRLPAPAGGRVERDGGSGRQHGAVPRDREDLASLVAGDPALVVAAPFAREARRLVRPRDHVEELPECAAGTG